jgi:hypothetical protein
MLAGSDVFLPNAQEHARCKIAICARHKIEGQAGGVRKQFYAGRAAVNTFARRKANLVSGLLSSPPPYACGLVALPTTLEWHLPNRCDPR